MVRIISPLNGTKSQTIGWKGHDGAVSWGQGGGDKGPRNWNSGTGRTSNQLRVNQSNKNIRRSKELSKLPTLIGHLFPQPTLKGNSPNKKLLIKDKL